MSTESHNSHTAALALELPESVLKELEKKAKSEDVSMECIIADAIMVYLGLNDPKTKAEIHIKLSQKYFREADELLKKEDFVQASEKAWGAVSQLMKAVAARKGIELRSHSELHKFVTELVTETDDKEIRRLWQSAGMLHQNFYENWLPKEMVIANIEDVKELVKKLKLLTD